MVWKRQAEIAARKLEVLRAIVESYIETGEPVASGTIARWSRRPVSAATIRNLMADLAEEGYLDQPHPSAGRVPTEKAFRHYVACLAAGRLPSADLERVREQILNTGTISDRLERSSQVLTQMTQGVGIAVAIPTAAQMLEQIEMVALAERRVLVIVVTADRLVRERVVDLDEAVTQDELVSIRNYLNRNFRGWRLGALRSELEDRLKEESAAYDAVLRKLTVLYHGGMLEVGLSPEVRMEGASNLVGLDLHLTRERLRDLFQALEEKKRLLQILDRFLDPDSDKVGVQVGLGEAHPSMRELSLIGATVSLPSGLTAQVAVLGPMRMNYPKAMSVVLHVSRAFQSVPAGPGGLLT